MKWFLATLTVTECSLALRQLRHRDMGHVGVRHASTALLVSMFAAGAEMPDCRQTRE